MYLLRCSPEEERLRAGDGLDGFLSGTRPSDLLWRNQGYYIQSDKMVSILIRFVKLIGHFLLCKTCPVYHTANSLDRNNSDMYQLVSIVPTLRQLLHSLARMTWSSMSKVNHLQFMEQLPDILQTLISVQDWLEKLEHSWRKQSLISGIENQRRLLANFPWNVLNWWVLWRMCLGQVRQEIKSYYGELK